MAQINDQVMPSLALDFGSAGQNPSGQVNQNIQAVAQVEDYRRVLSSHRQVIVSDGAGSSSTLTFDNGLLETRRFFLVRMEHNIGAALRVLATIQRGSTALIMQAMQAVVPDQANVYIVGRFDRQSLALLANVQAQYPDEIIQPPDSSLIFKIDNVAGGLIPAGTITFETSYWREPPLRVWRNGPPDAVVIP